MTKSFIVFLLLMGTTSAVWAKRIKFPLMGRTFTLVVPDKAITKPAPLILALHGCKQNPDLFLDGSLLDLEANRLGFFILAPEQPSYFNSDHCWNWFFEYQQERNLYNEMFQIMAGVELISKQYPINRNKIFVTGISAGGVMAHNLTVCYPDYFKASAIHSGLNFKIAENMSEAQTVLTRSEQKSPDYLARKMYESSKSVKNSKLDKVLIIHGLKDTRVYPFHADLIQRSQAIWRDYLDDGRRNDSARGEIQLSQYEPRPGYAIQQTDTVYSDFSERLILIEGLGHAWGGGKAVSENFDPKGPSSNDLILKFFGITH